MGKLDFTRRYPCAPLAVRDTVNNFISILVNAPEIEYFGVHWYKNGEENGDIVYIRGFIGDAKQVFEADILILSKGDIYTWRVYEDKFNVVEKNAERWNSNK